MGYCRWLPLGEEALGNQLPVEMIFQSVSFLTP
jgi:hypothetical protein